MRSRGDNPLERDIQADVLRAYATRADMRLWRANTGRALSFDGKRVMSFGVKGQADLSGILNDGRRLEIETKTASGRLSREQRAFGEMIRRFNGVYIVARSVSDVEQGLRDAGTTECLTDERTTTTR